MSQLILKRFCLAVCGFFALNGCVPGSRLQSNKITPTGEYRIDFSMELLNADYLLKEPDEMAPIPFIGGRYGINKFVDAGFNLILPFSLNMDLNWQITDSSFFKLPSTLSTGFGLTPGKDASIKAFYASYLIGNDFIFTSIKGMYDIAANPVNKTERFSPGFSVGLIKKTNSKVKIVLEITRYYINNEWYTYPNLGITIGI